MIGFHGVVSPLLKRVSLNLVHQSDASTFLSQVDEDPCSLLIDKAQRLLQLVPAIAPEGAHHVAGHAFRVYADRHLPFSPYLAPQDHQVFLASSLFLNGLDPEIPEARWQVRLFTESHATTILPRSFASPGAILRILQAIADYSLTPQSHS